MARLFVFGMGYTAGRLAERLRADGWHVAGVGRAAFADRALVSREIAAATHLLSSVPPAGEADSVLTAYRDIIEAFAGWKGYLSSTGVYGDTGGAWIDEGAPTGTGRRSARAAADRDWLALGAHVFRLPGIYGPGRSALDRVAAGRAHRVDLPGQVFSRVHVDDIVSGVIAGFGGARGAYNLADDQPCSQNAVIEHAASLLGLPAPAFVNLDALSPQARAFYGENRRVANGKAKRLLGWRPLYPDYRTGLRALNAITSPTIASAPPAAESKDQR
jgi:nucleoside-diphosphate-sugar epimerase